MESLDIKKLAQTSDFDSFVIFLVIFRFYILFSNFMVVSVVFLNFYFCFLVKVRFLAYLRLYNFFKEVDFINIIFRENRPINLRFIFVVFFYSLNIYIMCLLLSLSSICIIIFPLNGLRDGWSFTSSSSHKNTFIIHVSIL
jgi:hypothetical protein